MALVLVCFADDREPILRLDAYRPGGAARPPSMNDPCNLVPGQQAAVAPGTASWVKPGY
jgi:hypothetical protein